jgi:hypothetical protein
VLLAATFIPVGNVDYLCIIYFWLRIVRFIKWSVRLCFRNCHFFGGWGFRKLSVVVSCQLLYYMNLAHFADCPQVVECGVVVANDKKWQLVTIRNLYD